MDLNMQVLPASTITVFVPTGTDTSQLVGTLLSIGGGFSSTSGMGHWLNPQGHEMVEQCVQYTVSFDPRQFDAISEALSIGKAFMRANPRELAFLAVVYTEHGPHTIHITREGADT